MCPLFEDDDDPKRPRPVIVPKKRDNHDERAETRKDEDRDHHRQVRV